MLSALSSAFLIILLSLTGYVSLAAMVLVAYVCILLRAEAMSKY